MLLYFFVTMPSNSCATNLKPVTHMNGILNICMLITNISANKYAYIVSCKPTAHLLYQLLLYCHQCAPLVHHKQDNVAH